MEVQENNQQDTIESLRAQNTTLSEENSKLKKRVSDLEAEIAEITGVHKDSSEEQPDAQNTTRVSKENVDNDEDDQSENNSEETNVKTKMCKYYVRGNCTRGEACRYAHGTSEIRRVPRRPERYEYGRSDRSDRNRRPPNYKTVLCNNWEEDGHCPRGGRCTFAHGEDELREL